MSTTTTPTATKVTAITHIHQADTITLSHGGAAWQGTFSVALDALLDDALSDGPVPDFTAVVEASLEGGGWKTLSLTGTLAAVSPTHLTFEDGRVVERDELLAVTF